MRDDDVQVQLPRAVIVEALTFWMSYFKEMERNSIRAVQMRGLGGSTGMDVELYHRVEAERDRIGQKLSATSDTTERPE